MKKPSRRAAALLLVAAGIVGGFAWVVATQGPLAPVQVTVAAAAEASLPRTIFGIGTVEARRSYNLGPTAAGRVLRVLVDHGDTVAPRQVLAEMDPVDLDERQRAAASAAERATQQVRAAEAAVAEADSRRRVAEASAARYADLRHRGFVSAEAADAKRHEANAADAAQAGARASLAAARDEATRTAAERSGAARVRAQLVLASPVAGIVAARLAEPGTTVVAGQAVLQIIDPATLWVRARIDQGRSAGLAPGQPVQVALRSRPGERFAGRIARVDLVGDAVTEERIVCVDFDAAPPGLGLGELAEVDIQLPPSGPVLAIPAAALKHAGRDAGVWLLRDGHAAFRAVTAGAAGRDGRVAVIAGLAAGEQVIVHSSRPLAADQRVKVVDRLVAP